VRGEADNSPPSSAEVKKEWSYNSTPNIRLHGLDRDKFTFFFTVTQFDRTQNDCRLSYLESTKLCVDITAIAVMRKMVER